MERFVDRSNVIFSALFFVFLIQLVGAADAGSSSYSVRMFGDGLYSGESESSSYEAIVASFDSASTRNAESDEYTANLGFFNGTGPSSSVFIESYSIYPKTAVAVANIRFYISVVNAESVWAEITRPDGIVENIVLANRDYEYYTAGIVGRYDILFYANRSTGEIASALDYFDINDQSSSSSAPSSSSSASSAESQCEYIWDCSPWSLCKDGKQKRECKNIGSCSGTKAKPSEELSCSEALFDIAVKLNSLDSNWRDRIIFGIDMIENKGNDEIDVYVKYSIINENNTEIFSQIETKAVQSNLSYKKEIDGLNLSMGKYILRVDILYGYLQRAFAEQKFEINGAEKENKSAQNSGVKISTKGMYLLLLLILSVPGILKIFYHSNEKTGRFNSLLGSGIVKMSLPISFMGIFLMVLSNVFIFSFTVSSGSAVYSENSDQQNSGTIFYLIVLAVLLGLLVYGYFARKKKQMNIIDVNKAANVNDAGINVNNLIGKKIYVADGNYFGKVEEVVLHGNRIYGLKVWTDEKILNKKVLLRWNCILSCAEVIMIDPKVLDILSKKS